MEIKNFEGHGRKLTVEFMCWRCKKTASRPLKDCLPKEEPMMDLSDLIPPANWRNGGFYYPTFCPDCAEKYEKFMRGKKMANEKRLIDANALIAEYDRVHIGPPGGARKLMEDAPTVDAVEVVHGRWEKAEYCGYVRCNQCKDVYIDESWLDDGRWHYCPNCGAKMDGGNEQ